MVLNYLEKKRERALCITILLNDTLRSILGDFWKKSPKNHLKIRKSKINISYGLKPIEAPLTTANFTVGNKSKLNPREIINCSSTVKTTLPIKTNLLLTKDR